jgi:hypothetical protein
MKRWLILIVFILGAFSIFAQDDSIPRQAALSFLQTRIAERPLSWSYEILQQTNNSALGCSLVGGADLGRAVVPYRYTFIYSSGSYVVHAASDGTLVVPCDPKLLNAPTPTPAVTALPGVTPVAITPIATSAVPVTAVPNTGCQIITTGSFANVRETQSLQARQVGQIFSGQSYNVVARGSSATDVWYFIGSGWVSGTAVTAQGNCNAIATNDGLVGTGVGLARPSTDINVLNALQAYPCPANFTDYLPPRIRVGDATARVISGGIPNTLRAQPVANDAIGARLGVIQPGRLIERVINGPACSEGYVWWLVQAGTITGWTVESSFDDDDYFLEATPGNEVTSLPVASGQVVSLQLREDAQNTPSSAVFTSDGLFVLADSALQSGTSVVAEYDANTGTPTDLGMAVAGQLLRTNQVLSNGTVVIADETSLYFFNKQNNTYQQGTVLSNVLIVNQTTGTFAVSPDGTVVVISTCTDANCTTVNTYLRAINQPDAIWTAQLPAQFRPQKIFFSPDGQTVAMFGGQAVYFFDRATGIQLGLVSNATPQALTNGVCVLGEVTLWDTSSYQAVGIVETNQAEPVAIAYSPNGQLIFVGDTNGEIVVRNGENGESVTSFTIGNGQQATEISSLAVSADNTKLVASTVAGVFIWNIADLSDSGARG